jgi:hypothetical protein
MSTVDIFETMYFASAAVVAILLFQLVAKPSRKRTLLGEATFRMNCWCREIAIVVLSPACLKRDRNCHELGRYARITTISLFPSSALQNSENQVIHSVCAQ